MPEHHANTWDEFEKYIIAAETHNKESLYPLLFRGQQNACWPLTTTLERKTNVKSVTDYYSAILRCKSEIEMFTDISWDTSALQNEFENLRDYDWFSRKLGMEMTMPADNYMAYLRHHGFPSPLLDWSRSPYVAALFAFKEPGPQHRAVYIFAEQPQNTKGMSSDEPAIYSLRRVAKPHKRHFLQQSEYTVSVKYDLKKSSWDFVPHCVTNRDWETGQDYLIKITFPSELRISILSHLDRFNLNAFSLFTSDESLMDTIAFHQFDMRAGN